MSFEEWKKTNKKGLMNEYRKYLRATVLGDEDFNVRSTEDYDTWAREEYEKDMEMIEGDE